MPLSISEKTFVEINGARQGMFLKGTDAANPMLLFLHGGPGLPEYFLTPRYPTGIEDCFTVCWWEQRGSGLSYHPGIPPETITLEKLIADTLEVTNNLRRRFGQEKIYLLGHSWGSFLGIQAAARAPELYHAYVGMGQMSYQLRSECLAYEYALEQYKARGNTRMVRRLEANPVTMNIPLPPAWMRMRDDVMHGLGVGTTREMKSVVTGLFVPSWLNRDYTLVEKLNIWRGKAFSKRLLWNKMLGTDLNCEAPKLDLPTYFLQGVYDYTVCYSLAKDYFDRLAAPLKGFYTFERSAHTPLFEEPAKAMRILREDVLAGRNTLADREAVVTASA